MMLGIRSQEMPSDRRTFSPFAPIGEPLIDEVFGIDLPLRVDDKGSVEICFDRVLWQLG